jgi:copper chaperone
MNKPNPIRWTIWTGMVIIETQIAIEIEKGAPIMESRTFSIPNISCGHCTMTIENELKELDGITEVKGSVADKTVTVKWQAPATMEQIQATLKEINYPAV